MHSVPLARFREGSSISTSMGQTLLHLPQWRHLSGLTFTRVREYLLMGLRKTVMGHTYLQNARLSRKAQARPMPTA